jgi:hypothetical protein
MGKDDFQFPFDEKIEALKESMGRRMEALLAHIMAAPDARLLDDLSRQTCTGAFQSAGADEGTVWIADSPRKYLIPIYNTGPTADRFVGSFRQPLGKGLISMVYATEQPFAENHVSADKRHSKLLDRRLKLITGAMIAVPFYFLKQCRGVVSCVTLGKGTSGDNRTFSPEDMHIIRRCALVVGRLIDQRLMSGAMEGLRT